MTSCGPLPERFVQMHATVAVGVMNTIIGAFLIKSQFLILKLKLFLSCTSE